MTQTFLASTIAAFLLAAPSVSAHEPWFGADLSYVNEMQVCGAHYLYQGEADPYAIFAKSGTNIVRVRLWNNPTWTKYSNIADVTKTIAAAKARGMKVLLDFHYSDDWADGDHQIVPAAWAKLDTDAQAKALYQFTLDTLNGLKAKGLMPDAVQVGNETNHEIMLPGDGKPTQPSIDWARNAKLFNAGIRAVRDASQGSAAKPEIMLHIAQPENVEAWFADAARAGITDFDIIGMSYYRKWSKFDLATTAETIRRVHARFGKEVVIVETAYPFTDDYADNAPNLLGSDAALPGYPVTQEGQAKYMHDLMQLTLDSGGMGVVYWEPAWVSTKCSTRWAQGSNWENAALFDFKGKALPALEWPKASYVLPVEITFTVPDHGQAAQYLSADFTGGVDVAMTKTAQGFVYKARLRPGSEIVVGTAETDAGLDTAEALSVAVPASTRTVALVKQ